LFLAATCFIMLSPFIWTIMSVTKPTNVAFVDPPVFLYQPTLTAFVDLWQTTEFYRYLGNTIVVAVISTIVALAIGLPAAYALSRVPGWISAVLLVLALVFRALPRFAVVLPMYEITKSLGIYDTTYALALALIAINQPFSIWLLRNFFAEIPPTLDEAAMIDGCSRFQVLRRVMIPLMGPGILTAGIFVFLFAFQEYLTALILTDVNAKTVPVFIATQLGQTLPMLQQAGAAAVLLTIPVIGIAFIAQKYLVAGLNAGAVKG
jgi:multiple sugar transport system permease protein